MLRVSTLPAVLGQLTEPKAVHPDLPGGAPKGKVLSSFPSVSPHLPWMIEMKDCASLLIVVSCSTQLGLNFRGFFKSMQVRGAVLMNRHGAALGSSGFQEGSAGVSNSALLFRCAFEHDLAANS